MRETLLFIKVVLLLVAFVDTGSARLAPVGFEDARDFSASSDVFSCNLGLAYQNTHGDDEDDIIADSSYSFLPLGSLAPAQAKALPPIERAGHGFLARAPPVNTSITA